MCVCECVSTWEKKKKKAPQYERVSCWRSRYFNVLNAVRGSDGTAWFESDHQKDTHEHTHKVCPAAELKKLN